MVPEDLESTLVVVQCDFIANSNAEGCMVVLFSENGNMTLNLTRNMNTSCTKVNLLNESIQMVYGFDIEADGSVGTLSVIGVIETKANGLKCDVEVKVKVKVTLASSFGKTNIFVTRYGIFTIDDKQ